MPNTNLAKAAELIKKEHDKEPSAKDRLALRVALRYLRLWMQTQGVPARETPLKER